MTLRPLTPESSSNSAANHDSTPDASSPNATPSASAAASALATPSEPAASEHSHTGSGHYVRVWGILMVLLFVSIAGPTLEIQWVTVITAFGVALVKAYLVAKHFMHLHIERRYIVYLLGACLGLILMMFAGIAPDVMHHRGMHWENVAAGQSAEH